ncbi:hypothetical protein V6N13_059980 [Hibiscus sabdariffa]|uniref:Uncharacterized protein n=1 Tax=Hibiscus sabdariffa TaxID=183260 RepID=A0ABR2GBC4_9ROSI
MNILCLSKQFFSLETLHKKRTFLLSLKALIIGLDKNPRSIGPDQQWELRRGTGCNVREATNSDLLNVEELSSNGNDAAANETVVKLAQTEAPEMELIVVVVVMVVEEEEEEWIEEWFSAEERRDGSGPGRT